MKRRDFLSFVGAAVAAASKPARAQPKIRRLGVLSQGSLQTHPTPVFRAFQQGLRDLGWVEGQNLAIEWRFSEGSAEPLPRLAAELVGLPVELIVASPTRPALAAKEVTSTIPVVFIQVADPVQSGIVANLARPGRAPIPLRNIDKYPFFIKYLLYYDNLFLYCCRQDHHAQELP